MQQMHPVENYSTQWSKSHRHILGHVHVDLLSTHAVENTRVGIKDAASQGIVVLKSIFVASLLLLDAETLHRQTANQIQTIAYHSHCLQ